MAFLPQTLVSATVFVLFVSTCVASVPMQLFLLSDSDALCNDGSHSGYYFRPSVNASDVWIVHLQGVSRYTMHITNALRRILVLG